MTVVHHSAICTSDVERSLAFWRDGMGMQQIFDHEFAGDWRTLFGVADDQLRAIFLGDPSRADSGIVELVAFESAEGGSQLSSQPRHGFFLLSFQVDVDAVLERLAGLGFTEGVRRIDQSAPGGLTVPMAVVHAPDGVLVELIGAAR